MNSDIKKIVLDQIKLQEIIKSLAKKISIDYKNKKPIFIGLLKGCQPFLSDLLKEIDIYCYVDYLIASSYCGGTSSTGVLTIKKDIETDISGKNVIIVDDIIDTGLTLSNIIDLFKSRNAASIEVVSLLNKKEGRLIEVDVKYIGIDIDNEFVVGYGLDYQGLYRNLPYVGVLKEEIYK